MAAVIRARGNITIYKIIHRKLKIESSEPHYKPRVNSGTPEELTVPAPHVTPVVLLNDTNIILHGTRLGHQYT